jgi:hypothetical protein
MGQALPAAAASRSCPRCAQNPWFEFVTGFVLTTSPDSRLLGAALLVNVCERPGTLPKDDDERVHGCTCLVDRTQGTGRLPQADLRKEGCENKHRHQPPSWRYVRTKESIHAPR